MINVSMITLESTKNTTQKHQLRKSIRRKHFHKTSLNRDMVVSVDFGPKYQC